VLQVDVNEEGTVFVASIFGYYNTYLSRKYAHLGWYVGIKKSGKPKRGSKTKWGQKAIQFLPRRLTQ
jgi:fibroblast growth factor 1